MSEPFQAHLTAAGLAAAFTADSAGLSVAVTHVAAGDAGYAPAVDGDGIATQTALVSERERVAISGGAPSGARQVSISALLDGAGSYWVRELGFFLSDGTLFAVWADPARTLTHKSAETPLALGFDLAVGQLPDGAVTITASGPPFELMMTGDFAALAAAIAQTQVEQLRQADRIRQISGDWTY